MDDDEPIETNNALEGKTMNLNIKLYRELRAEGYAATAAIFYARRNWAMSQ